MCYILPLDTTDPFMLPEMRVDTGAIKHVLRGADVMCPGLTSAGGRMTRLPANVVVVCNQLPTSPTIITITFLLPSTLAFAGGGVPDVPLMDENKREKDEDERKILHKNSSNNGTFLRLPG